MDRGVQLEHGRRAADDGLQRPHALHLRQHRHRHHTGTHSAPLVPDHTNSVLDTWPAMQPTVGYRAVVSRSSIAMLPFLSTPHSSVSRTCALLCPPSLGWQLAGRKFPPELPRADDGVHPARRECRGSAGRPRGPERDRRSHRRQVRGHIHFERHRQDRMGG